MSRGWSAGLVAATLVAAAIGMLSVRRAMDFPIYYDAAIRALHHDRNLYDIGDLSSGVHYRYAPVIALLLAPFTLLPLPIATFAWYVIKIGAIAMSVLAGVRLTSSGERPWRVFLFAFLLAGGYVVEEIRTGNAHFLAISCLVLALYLMERGRRGWPSVLIALAILAKVTPALALPYLAVRRRWRVLAGTIVVFGALCLAPSLVVGNETNRIWFGDWTRTVLDRVDARPHEQDDSLKGALLRLFPAADAPTGRTPSVTIVNVPRAVVLATWLLACVAILGALLWTAADRNKPRGRRVFEYGLLVVAILLVSPHNTRIYYSALFFPYVLLVIAALDDSPGPFRSLLRAGLWVSFVLNTVMPAIVPGRMASLAYQALSPFVLTSFIAFAALLWLTRAREPWPP